MGQVDKIFSGTEKIYKRRYLFSLFIRDPINGAVGDGGDTVDKYG